MVRRFSLLLLPALVAILAACGSVAEIRSVSVDGEQLRLAVGETTTLEATVEVTGAASQEVVWSSSDEGIATVNDQGVVTAHIAGAAEIRATSVVDESKEGSATVVVIEAPDVTPVEPGDADAEVDGEPATVVTDYDDGSVTLQVGDSQLAVGFAAGDGEQLAVANGGVPRVTADGSVTISGSGYGPGSPVDVWLFSEPAWLGSLVADASGEFSGTFGLPAGLALGNHTLVMDGVLESGATLQMKLGLEVQAGNAVREFAHCPVGTDWFVSAETGSDEASGNSIVEPFATIQTAVDAAADRDTVCVAAGVYELDNRLVEEPDPEEEGDLVLVNIEKPLTLVGPNVGVRGQDGRGSEAALVASGADDDELWVVQIHSSDVTLDGFLITTDSPQATDPFPNGVYGVQVFDSSTGNVVIRNNVIVDANYPIHVLRSRDPVAASGFVIQSNRISGPEASADQAIYLQGGFGEVRDNFITEARVGLQVQPYQLAGSGVVADNVIEAFQVGLWFNYQENADSHWQFLDNEVVGVESAWGWPLFTEDRTAWAGIRVETFYEGSVLFEGNRIDSGATDAPADGAVYLLRQRLIRNGEIENLGTVDEPGAFFTANEFVDYPEGVTSDDLSMELSPTSEALQLRLR